MYTKSKDKWYNTNPYRDVLLYCYHALWIAVLGTLALVVSKFPALGSVIAYGCFATAAIMMLVGLPFWCYCITRKFRDKNCIPSGSFIHNFLKKFR